MNKWAMLVVAILICQLAGAIGSFFTAPAIPTWYASLNKPDLRPPNWAFAPVWITLYTLMGISLYLVWAKGLKSLQLITFSIQLVLNVIWSYLFFGLQSTSYGFIEIVILWISILATILSFYKTSKKAALLLAPYIAWVTVAMILNYYVMILNPGCLFCELF